MKTWAQKYLHKRILYPLFAGFLVFLLVKYFLIDFVPVRTPSMQPALKTHEWVTVKKIVTPKQNDIVMISLPLSENDPSQEKYKTFKRIVGMPGDSIAVRKSRVYVNGGLLSINSTFIHNYMAKIETQEDTVVFDEHGIKERYLIDDSCVYLIILNDEQYGKLQADKQMYSLRSNAEDSALYDESIFPFDAKTKWNKDYFGPLYIPKKGDVIDLTPDNIKLYELLITGFEGNALEIERGKIFINEKEVTSYTVKQNYYFVIGDNIDNSLDSRHWGYVPEKNIKGVLLFNR